MKLSAKFTKKLLYAPLLSIGLMTLPPCSQAKSTSPNKKQESAMTDQKFHSAATLDANKLIDQLIRILDLPLSDINKPSVEKIFGTRLRQLDTESTRWGVLAEKDWHYNLQVETSDLPTKERFFYFGFDQGEPPNYKHVPLCLDPKTIIDHLVGTNWKYDPYPSLPGHQPFEWYTKDGKKASLDIVGKDNEHTDIRCLGSLTLGVSK
jgi:hypothetical protein